jgi:methylmalonyl-CoA mutase C-terminal domain/subunit
MKQAMGRDAETKVGEIRILLSKLGLDAHDRGLKFVANGLLQAGMEVIYLGNFNIPEGIVRAAIDEAVDAIGLSVLSGEYLHYLPQLRKLLNENGVGNLPIVIGGLIPPEEEERLMALGVKRIFRPGSTMDEIKTGITEAVRG